MGREGGVICPLDKKGATLSWFDKILDTKPQKHFLGNVHFIIDDIKHTGQEVLNYHIINY